MIVPYLLNSPLTQPDRRPMCTLALSAPAHLQVIFGCLSVCYIHAVIKLRVKETLSLIPNSHQSIHHTFIRPPQLPTTPSHPYSHLFTSYSFIAEEPVSSSLPAFQASYYDRSAYHCWTPIVNTCAWAEKAVHHSESVGDREAFVGIETGPLVPAVRPHCD